MTQLQMKKVYLSFIFLYLLSPLSSTAGNEYSAAGARSAGLANASVSLSDLWSINNNQAGLAFLKSPTAGVCYENRFLVKELSLKSGAAAIPVKGGTVGIIVSSFGYTAYSENKYGLAFAKSFGENLSAGIQLDYLSTKIGDVYGSTGVPAAELGVQAKPMENLTIGAHVFNINRAKLADQENEHIPSFFRMGIDYRFSEKVFVAVEVEKNIDHKAELKTGIEYRPLKEFFLRTGISSNPVETSFGFGLYLKGFRIDFASSLHPSLGFTPNLGLAYEINKAPSLEVKDK